MTFRGRPLKDIWHYFVGNYRFKVFYSGFKNWLLRKHIREQIQFRFDYVPDICWNQGSCKECGCQIPHLQMAHKSCDDECYPELMNSKDWKNFQIGIHIKQKNKYWFYNNATKYITLTEINNEGHVSEHKPKYR